MTEREYDLSLYQNLTPEEDVERTNVHYMLPARFFMVLTGGQWNTYSANLWDTFDEKAASDPHVQTAAQERKLDAFAELLELVPGARVLDVGAGWGGPLTYLCKRYGVVGHGLMLSERQREVAVARAKEANVDCTFSVCHWQNFESREPFDAIMTDEVIVHFFRLEDFFRKANGLLGKNGLMVNKEAHFVHPAYGEKLSRGGLVISEVYGGTGNYRCLADELAMANRAGFGIEEIRQIDHRNYIQTARAWRGNILACRSELEALVGNETFDKFNRYLMLVELMFRVPRRQCEVHFVKCRKLWEPERQQAT